MEEPRANGPGSPEWRGRRDSNWFSVEPPTCHRWRAPVCQLRRGMRLESVIRSRSPTTRARGLGRDGPPDIRVASTLMAPSCARGLTLSPGPALLAPRGGVSERDSVGYGGAGDGLGTQGPHRSQSSYPPHVKIGCRLLARILTSDWHRLSLPRQEDGSGIEQARYSAVAGSPSSFLLLNSSAIASNSGSP